MRGRDVTATMDVQVAKAHRGYRHEALIYRGTQGFLDAVSRSFGTESSAVNR